MAAIMSTDGIEDVERLRPCPHRRMSHECFRLPRAHCATPIIRVLIFDRRSLVHHGQVCIHMPSGIWWPLSSMKPGFLRGRSPTTSDMIGSA